MREKKENFWSRAAFKSKWANPTAWSKAIIKAKFLILKSQTSADNKYNSKIKIREKIKFQSPQSTQGNIATAYQLLQFKAKWMVVFRHRLLLIMFLKQGNSRIQLLGFTVQIISLKISKKNKKAMEGFTARIKKSKIALMFNIKNLSGSISNLLILTRKKNKKMKIYPR